MPFSTIPLQLRVSLNLHQYKIPDILSGIYKESWLPAPSVSLSFFLNEMYSPCVPSCIVNHFVFFHSCINGCSVSLYPDATNIAFTFVKEYNSRLFLFRRSLCSSLTWISFAQSSPRCSRRCWEAEKANTILVLTDKQSNFGPVISGPLPAGPLCSQLWNRKWVIRKDVLRLFMET